MRYGHTPLEGLPDRVRICEVGPRDGLQNESTVLPVEVKAEFVARLVDAGHTIIETTSFVHPKWVPQLADAEALLTAIRPAAGVRYPVLVPNERGLDRALDLGVRDIAVFGSATETFARRNLNRTVDFHDTYGQALANTLAALRRGVTTVDASAGGLGGCPYAGSATGNLATEDLLWQLEGLGIATGVDLQKMVETSVWMARKLGRPSPSRTVTALAGRQQEGEPR
jgi:isopropylmalate/homocitrate/citramalate synthase